MHALYFKIYNYIIERKKRRKMDAAHARQLKIKGGALTRTIKDHASYIVEAETLGAKVEEIKQQQAVLPAEDQEPGKVSRAEAALAETVAVMPTIVVKIETYLGDLEGVMGTIEDAKADEMDVIRETPEWKNAVAAV